MNAPVSNSARRLNGGQALAEMLKLSGVGPMFGMGGFQLLPFYEAMRALGLRHFLINDERCGAFASDAYARVTNRPGVCDATLGPGATNLVTALVESLNAGIPQIAIVGDANREHAWKNMTQEARQTEILKPGADPRRGDQAHPRALAPRIRGRNQRTARAGGARCAGGRLPWRA
jgi:acetolactate synthase I/II/III large subunit